MAPKPDKPSSYGGVLTGSAATVVATLLALGAVLTAGWKAHDVVSRADAATLDGSTVAQMQADITTIKAATAATQTDLGLLKADMLKVKCRWNIDGTCPPADQGPAVRTSGMGGR